VVCHSQLLHEIIKGGCVVRISIPYVYNLHEALIPLADIKQGDTVNDRIFAIFNAENLLDQFLRQSLWANSLRVCKQPGLALLDEIRSLIGSDIKGENELEYWRVVSMQQQLARFRAVMEAEFMTTASYLVTGRRGYDIATLIEAAEMIFPEELVRKVPDVLFDLREAGKCIAFDLGTAAGFHLLRALETVIRAYWNAVMEGASLPANRNLGAYIREMEKAGKGDPKVLTALRQIKDHHRNELMHPEEKLNLDEAIAILGIVQSAIIPMLAVIPNPLRPEGGETTPALPVI
jgi:hypothetical protein